jgi:hypothetical protein
MDGAKPEQLMGLLPVLGTTWRKSQAGHMGWEGKSEEFAMKISAVKILQMWVRRLAFEKCYWQIYAEESLSGNPESSNRQTKERQVEV